MNFIGLIKQHGIFITLFKKKFEWTWHNMNNSLFEKLSEIEHERWADWQKYLHSVCSKNIDGSLTIPQKFVENWVRQINTPYSQLSEKEKNSDREQVKRYWHLIE